VILFFSLSINHNR